MRQFGSGSSTQRRKGDEKVQTNQATLHNFWHSLAEAEVPPADLMNEGVNIQALKKGDIIKFETSRGNDGYASRVTLEMTHPKQGGVRIVQVVRFLGRLNLEVAKESFGRGITGIFVVRGDRHDGGAPKLGWIGIGADVRLTGDIIFRSVRNISINGSLVIFPPSNGTIQ